MIRTTFSRRDIVRGAGTTLSLGAMAGAGVWGKSLHADGEADDPADPHFFIILYFENGADPNYMFDARPLSFTAAGRVTNYNGVEPILWEGRNGVNSYASASCTVLSGLKEYFSVLNGAHMAVTFDGHEQNKNHIFTGNPFGGASFLPIMNRHAGAGSAPLDYLQVGNPFGLVINNSSSSATLTVPQAKTLTDALRSGSANNPEDLALAYLRQRYDALGAGNGRFAGGSRLMRRGLDQSFSLGDRMREVDLTNVPESFAGALQLTRQYFKNRIANQAMISVSRNLDTHSADAAVNQPELYRNVLSDIKSFIEYLRATPFDEDRGLSLFDVTTFMVTSEFGRTNSQMDSPIDKTGTDHNPHSNQVLLGGKGIQGGMVLGGSDLDQIDAQGAYLETSGAHRQFDEKILRKIGKPFDFATLRSRADLPSSYVVSDYLNYSSIVNTLYSLFGVPEAEHWILGRNMPAAPILRGLLS